MSQTPTEISQTIYDQLRAGGIRSAFCYVGGHRPTALAPTKDRPAPALRFNVNGARDQLWQMAISYNYGADDYNAKLIRTTRPGSGQYETLAESEGLYVEEMLAWVEREYDNAIRKHNDGFIPID